MPAYTFKSPEGQSYTINGPDGSTTEQAFGVLQQHLTNQRAQGVVPVSMKDVDATPMPHGPNNVEGSVGYDPTLGTEQGTAGKFLVGAGENVLAGVTGGVRSLQDALTGADPGTHGTGYQPRTEAGKAIQSTVGKAVSTAGGYVADKLDLSDAARQTFAERIPEALGAVGTVAPIVGATGALARGAIRTAVGDSAGVAPAAAVEHPIQAVVRNGFEIAPNDIPRRSATPLSDVPGNRIQAFTETPGVTAARNQRNTIQATRIASRELGGPETTHITAEHLEGADAAPAATYDRTGQAMGTLDHVQGSTIDNLRAVMTDQTPQGAVPAMARTQLNRAIEGLQSGQYQGTQIIRDISYFRNEVGGAGGRAAADVLENEMEHQLRNQPETLEGFRAARTQFAKNRDVADALRGGVIDPQAMLRLREGAKDRPLSGGLNDIAEAAAQAPNSVKLPGAVLAGETPLSKTGIVTQVAKGALRAVAPKLNTPARQSAIAASAEAPGPLPNPAGLSRTAAPAPPVMGSPPGAVGVAPRQLGMELAPGRGTPFPPDFDLAPPEGSVIEPSQRSMPVPQGRPFNPTGAVAGSMDDAAAGGSVNSDRRLNLTRQILEQIRRRNGKLPGTLSDDE
jgi:hypothetical protein